MIHLRSIATFGALLSLGAAADAQAVPVPACDVLSLYANGVASRLCRNISPIGQNLLVCELTDDNPDVHLTFGFAGLPNRLHITVRTPRGVPTCEGNAFLTGRFHGPAGAAPLGLEAGQPAVICRVVLANYVARLNAQGQVPAAAGETLVLAAMTVAQHSGRVTPAIAAGYIARAGALHCP